jgi:hypothetical protein
MVKYLPNVRTLEVSHPDEDARFEDLLALFIGDDAGVVVKRLHYHDGYFYAHTEIETLRFTGDLVYVDRFNIKLWYWRSDEAYAEAS